MENIGGSDYTHRSQLGFKIKIYDADKSSAEKPIVFLNTNEGSLISESAKPFIEELADGNDVELGALFELNGDKRHGRWK